MLTVLKMLDGESPEEVVLGETELLMEVWGEEPETNDWGESASFSSGGERGLMALTGTDVPDPPTLSENEKVKADCLS